MFKCKIEKAFFSDEFISTALDCVSHVQSLSLLLRKTIKQKHRYPCVRKELTQINLFNDTILSLLA